MLASNFIPMDRRYALVSKITLPQTMIGSVLFADISGFTTLTQSFVTYFGPQRGAEELIQILNSLYAALLEEVDRYRGSVISFSGDAFTAWFEGDQAERATSCALSLQAAMQNYNNISIYTDVNHNFTSTLALKVAVSYGTVRRFVVGDPLLYVLDAMAGQTLETLAKAEQLAQPGEVVLTPAALAWLSERLTITDWRTPNQAADTGAKNNLTQPDEVAPDALVDNAPFAVISALHPLAEPNPWPVMDSEKLDEAEVRPWVLPTIWNRVRQGQLQFLTEIRPIVAIFLNFAGIDYDHNPDAPRQLDSYVRWVQSVVNSYEGNILSLTIGDKGSYLYLAFGAPLAHADDATRAVAVALELIKPPSNLAFVTTSKIGINLGRGRAGLYGANTCTYGAMGDPVNVAARLMQLAEPGQILVSGELAELTRRHFTLEPLGEFKLKGRSGATSVFTVRQGRLLRSIQQQEPQYNLPLVGREKELGLLKELLTQLQQNKEARLVGITAPAGMGKSRLIAALLKHAAVADFDIYGGECQTYGMRSPYGVWQSIWRSFFNLSADLSQEAQRQQLEEFFHNSDPSLVPQLFLLNSLFDLGLPEPTRLDPRVRKQSMHKILLECLRKRASQQPQLIVIEDAQWLDSLSQDLLEAIGQAESADFPVLIILSYRPPQGALNGEEPAQAITRQGLTHFTEIVLEDFSATESFELIRLKLEQLFGIFEVPPLLVERVIALAQGNPFYIEELVNYLQDRQIDPHDTATISQLALPDSLHSLILSRIDALSESQQIILKVASIIGRVFQVSWLWGVDSSIGLEKEVEENLAVLSRLEITPLDDSNPELSYLFKHLVTQEVAYENLALATRQFLHGQLATWLESNGEGTVSLDLLAFHYSRSTNWAKELEYSFRAGEQAQKNGAYHEATIYLRRALELVTTHPETPQAIEKELNIQLALGGVLIATKGQSSSQAKEAYDRARELCQQLPETPLLVRVLFGLWAYYQFRGEIKTSFGLAEQCFKLVKEAPVPNPNLVLQTHLMLANTYFWRGEFDLNLANFEQIVALYQPGQHLNYISQFVQNPRITVVTTAGLALWIGGQPDAALTTIQATLSIAEELKHDFSVVLTLQTLAALYLERGEVELLQRTVFALNELATKRGIELYALMGAMLQGWVEVAGGDGQQGYDSIKNGLAKLAAQGDVLVRSFYSRVLARACLLLKDHYAEGLTEIERELESVLANQRHCFLAELYRLKAELTLALQPDRVNEVEQLLQQALRVAQEQKAAFFEMRTARALAHLWQNQGRSEEALALLEPIYAKFEEGQALDELEQVATLLTELKNQL